VLLNFVRVALETAHDGFEVVGVDEAALLFVKQVEDFLQIRDLVLGEAVLLLAGERGLARSGRGFCGDLGAVVCDLGEIRV